MNLGYHVGDNPHDVKENRKNLAEILALPSDPCWLRQTHSKLVTFLTEDTPCFPESDAVTTSIANKVCAVLTADCLPVLFCDQSGSQVAAAHAGWRGLADGVLEETVKAFTAPAQEMLAWMGPAIGPSSFEVGADVRNAFMSHSESAAEAFHQTDERHWLADLYLLARQRLGAMGVTEVYGGGYCTMTDTVEVDDDVDFRFYSYRRNKMTGRMASLIWME